CSWRFEPAMPQVTPTTRPVSFSTSRRSSMPRTAGTRSAPRSTRPSMSGRSETSYGPSNRRSQSRSTPGSPGGAVSVTASTCSGSGAAVALRRPKIPTECSVLRRRGGARSSRQRLPVVLGGRGGLPVGGAEAPGGAVAGLPPRAAGQALDLGEVDAADLLDDQLGDAVPPPHGERLGPVGVEQVHEDLAPVAGVHGAGRVDDRDPVPGRETRPRVHETGVAVRQRDGHAGGNQRPLPRAELDVLTGVEVDAGVARVRLPRDRQAGVEAAQEDAHGGGVGHWIEVTRRSGMLLSLRPRSRRRPAVHRPPWPAGCGGAPGSTWSR